MSYDDERPNDWSTYDRVAGAASSMRFLLFEMRAGNHQANLRNVLGPENYERAREYLDCVDANVKKMGELALSFATTVLAQSTDPAVAAVIDRVRTRMAEDDANGAWNLVEAWVIAEGRSR